MHFDSKAVFSVLDDLNQRLRTLDTQFTTERKRREEVERVLLFMYDSGVAYQVVSEYVENMA